MGFATDALDLKFKFDQESKQISVGIFANNANSFEYVFSIPRGVVLRLRRICNSDKKFEKRSIEYQNYLIARDYNPDKVKKQY